MDFQGRNHINSLYKLTIYPVIITFQVIVPPSWIVKLPRKGSFKSSLKCSPSKHKQRKKISSEVLGAGVKCIGSGPPTTIQEGQESSLSDNQHLSPSSLAPEDGDIHNNNNDKNNDNDK